MARGSTTLPNLATRNKSVAITPAGLIISGSSAKIQLSGSANTTIGTTNTSSEKIASEDYVATQIANLVASAPTALNTLDELAAALGDDANYSTTISTALGNRLRVDTASQGLTSTQQGYGRTNLGLGTAATTAATAYATAAQGTKADTAHGWGNHASYGYLTSINNSNWSGTVLSLANGGTGASLSDPNADRVMFWDDSAGTVTWLSMGSNLSISGTTLNATDTNTTYSVGNGGLTEINFTSALNSKLSGIADNANNYSLPTATSSILGGVKIGSRISISSGVISADVQSDNNFTTAYKNKIDGIESGATADLTAAEILTLIKTVDGAGSGLDADTLDGNSSAAFATSTQGTKADTAHGWGNHASAGYLTSVTVNNNVNNRVITANGGASVDAEANLTFDGTTLVTPSIKIGSNYSLVQNGNDLEFRYV